MARRRDLGQAGQGLARTHPRGRRARAPPSAAGLASHTVQTTELGGPARGDDGGKNSTGRTRPLWVETLGVLLAVLLTRAGLDAGVAAPRLRRHVTPQALPRRVPIVAAQKDHPQALDAWRATQRTGWRLEVQARPEGIKGCTPLEQRWVIARTHAWHGRYRRHRKDDERSVESSPARLHVSHSHLLLHRLAPCDRPAFHSRRDAA